MNIKKDIKKITDLIFQKLTGKKYNTSQSPLIINKNNWGEYFLINKNNFIKTYFDKYMIMIFIPNDKPTKKNKGRFLYCFFTKKQYDKTFKYKDTTKIYIGKPKYKKRKLK